jgi:hypothetical protein
MDINSAIEYKYLYVVLNRWNSHNGIKTVFDHLEIGRYFFELYFCFLYTPTKVKHHHIFFAE